uniref:Lipocalin/cytosolic fatty-acid binding domain-containing protein n=1 Tax=Romanomermis culicivorax TaxID=13658 RepID=A0A915IYX2_ROMCU
MEAFIGTYTLIDNGDHFDDYMKKLGVGLPKREMAKLTHPTVTISKLPDGKYRMLTSSTITTQTLDFALATSTTFTMEGDKMVQNQKATKPGEMDSRITREIQGPKMLTTCTCENVTCVRTYEKKK